MPKLNQILIKRLEKMGIDPGSILSFIKALANSFSYNPHMTLPEMNRKLHSLGWADVDLDDHTLQIAIACFEAEGLESGIYFYTLHTGTDAVTRKMIVK